MIESPSPILHVLAFPEVWVNTLADVFLSFQWFIKIDYYVKYKIKDFWLVLFTKTLSYILHWTLEKTKMSGITRG